MDREHEAKSLLRQRSQPLHGFTLVELLVVLAIIVLLVSILIPAVVMARRVAEVGATERLLSGILIACQGFDQDHGEYPASSGRDDYSSAEGPGGHMLLQSMMGQYGDSADGKAGLGFRVGGHETGKVYGPYMSPGEYDIGTTDTDDGNFSTFQDAWESPIAYWRADKSKSDLWTDANGARFNGDDNEDLVGTPNLDEHPEVDATQLRTAEFVVYSKGSDRANGTSDDKAEQTDDIVMLGP